MKNAKQYIDDINKVLRKQTNDAYKQAELVNIKTGEGIGHNDELDAFRHAYVSAKQTRDNGELYANIAGKANEVKGSILQDQPKSEFKMDEHNNAVGREIGRRAKKENWSDERIAQEVKKSLDEDKLIINPDDNKNNNRKIDDFYEKQRKAGNPAYPENKKEQSNTFSELFNKEAHSAPMSEDGKLEFPNDKAVAEQKASRIQAVKEKFKGMGGPVEVEEYTRSDGTKVKSHTRGR